MALLGPLAGALSGPGHEEHDVHRNGMHWLVVSPCVTSSSLCWDSRPCGMGDHEPLAIPCGHADAKKVHGEKVAGGSGRQGV